MSNTKNEDKFSARASALGYLYQVWYALYLILHSNSYKDTGIFIEKLDDIQLDQGHLIQAKHHVNKESLTDSSPDLWKTIRVWSEHLQNDIISLTDDFILTLITTATAKDGSIASLLRNDSNRDYVEACKRLLDIAKKSQVAFEPSNKLTSKQLAFEAFKNLTEIKRSALVKKIHIIDNAPNISEIHKKISELLLGTREEYEDKIINRLIGWWDQQVCQHLLNKSKISIKKREINDELASIRDEYVPDNLPIQYADEKCEIDIENDDRRFVIHLKKVTDIKKDKPELEKAILYFYRANSERASWLRTEGLSKEIQRYEETLEDKWKERVADVRHEYDDIDMLDVKQKKKAGWKIFSETRKADIRIRERVTQSYIMQGSYHILANEDRVAWHPDEVDKIYGKEDL